MANFRESLLCLVLFPAPRPEVPHYAILLIWVADQLVVTALLRVCLNDPHCCHYQWLETWACSAREWEHFWAQCQLAAELYFLPCYLEPSWPPAQMWARPHARGFEQYNIGWGHRTSALPFSLCLWAHIAPLEADALSQTQWFAPVMPALGRLRQEDRVWGSPGVT